MGHWARRLITVTPTAWRWITIATILGAGTHGSERQGCMERKTMSVFFTAICLVWRKCAKWLPHGRKAGKLEHRPLNDGLWGCTGSCVWRKLHLGWHHPFINELATPFYSTRPYPTWSLLISPTSPLSSLLFISQPPAPPVFVSSPPACCVCPLASAVLRAWNNLLLS